MAEEFHSSKPIYLQVADRIYSSIVRGEISYGDKLPSVREMAVNMGVNPNTIQRTYAEIEREGIVETKRGQGTFVKEDPGIVSSLQNRMKKELIETFVGNMKELGLTADEMVEGVQHYFMEKGGNAE
ncbi:GntR family transcriptional regulator [Bacillus sp. OV322]|uniref:GntR family transcriptional regulator n=1 Tax=unclassified Bacillus (in: firmicutes) TaxID=185979 RepID=UPI0008E29312|nr:MULTISPECIES: GntR family transcriptional regulator [unclassified Bacillus (in: firmicutes)]OIK08169.1 GntR family transcriptional regulator [Bacillus sp. MUM 13]SFC94275.1 GntR family transcriptional regulator [Bacillus sp. OV322]